MLFPVDKRNVFDKGTELKLEHDQVFVSEVIYFALVIDQGSILVGRDHENEVVSFQVVVGIDFHISFCLQRLDEHV